MGLKNGSYLSKRTFYLPTKTYSGTILDIFIL